MKGMIVMLCENCGKKDANVKYTEIINGNKKEMHLCEECSKKLGVDELDFSMPSLDFASFFGDLLTDYEESDFFPNFIKEKDLTCEKCGMTFNEFTNIGKFGCNECYNIFSNKIDAILKNIHGNNKHIGRIGKLGEGNKTVTHIDEKKVNTNNKVNELKEKLKQLVKEEKYEEAAIIRDEIKKEENNG